MAVQPQSITVHNFTIAYNGRVRVIVTEASVREPIVNNEVPGGKPILKTNAIWDTGATGSVITQKAAKELGLFPISKAQVHGVNKSSLQNVYLVAIGLPNNIMIGPLRVTECESLNGPYEILIGMDIISMGDFALTNSNGQSVFSFRIPSVSRIDFTTPENNHINPGEQNMHLTRTERRALDRIRKKPKKGKH